MTPFEEWNLLLLREFFPQQDTPREVFIGATPGFLNQAGSNLGGDAGFLEAVKNGPPWLKVEGLVERVQALVLQRTNMGRRPPGYVDPHKHDETYRPDGDAKRSAPTYLPYLALLARTASVSDPSGYYARLQSDLGLPKIWGSAQMKGVGSAWTDLQEWTQKLGSARGRFVVRQLGKFALIGIPKSQVMFRSGDDVALGEIFTSLSLQPRTQISGPDIERAITSIAAGEHRVSTGLMQAATDSGYRAELRKIVEAFFEEWKGPIEPPPTKATGAQPSDRRRSHDDEQAGDAPTGKAKFGLVLPHGRLPWRIQVEVEAEEDADLTDKHGEWQLRHRSERSLVATLPANSSKEFMSGQDWRPNVFGKAIRLERRPLWVLTPTVLPDGGAELWDEGLPSHGAAYALVTDEHAPAFTEYLEKYSVRSQEVSQLDGLPFGWRMVLFDRCQDLTDAQRNGLPVRLTRRQPIRLEGGTRLRIENSYRYLHYDLPEVVLAASLDASIECNGEPLTEITSPIDTSNPNSLVCGSVRRYQLPESIESGGTYRIIAKDEHGKVAGEKTVKVARDDFTLSGMLDGQQTGLDCFGRPSTAPEAMRGGLPADQIWKIDPTGDAGGLIDHAENFGSPLDLGAMDKDECALFLDYLSKQGSMSFGRARAALARMSEKGGGETRSPSLLLKDLFARGHLEISRTEDGHITHVHAVAPQAYFLPVKTREHNPRCVVGVLGTMSISHWEFLAQASGQHLWSSVWKRGAPRTVVHLLTSADYATLSKVLASAGIGLLPSPSVAIAKWSASEAQARNSILDIAHDRLPNGMGSPREFNAESLGFPKAEARQQLGADGAYAFPGNKLGLFEYEDRHIRGFRKYLLASKKGLSAVQDSQWGVWIALGASGKGLRHIDRFHVDRNGKHDLWLPESLRLPSVLERALVLCSGESPEEHRLSETETGDGIELTTPNGVHVETLRKDALSHLSKRTWLRYKRIPRSLVRAIQSKGT